MALHLKELIKRAKDYVEIEAKTRVLRVTFAEQFTIFGNNDVVLSVTTTRKDHPKWWVVGGSTPMNLYSKSYIKTADEAFSFHTGIMMRFLDEDFEVSRVKPKNVGYDAFICHASEDKERFVSPLAESLSKLGLKIWYDEFELRVGDNLKRSIDKGLVNSRFGIVVLSKAFFKKKWPKYELDGLTAREMDGRKVILPIWYGITKKYVMKYSPSLADKIAIDSSKYSIRHIAKILYDEIKK